MSNPSGWMLVIKHEDGTRGYINLWQAITEGRLTVKVNPLNRAWVTDICADTEENRHDIDTNFGTVPEGETT